MDEPDESSTGSAFADAASDDVRDHWDDLMDDAATTAEEFRAAGWETLELHPGDVTVTTMEQFGLDVLVPDDEFERLESWVETGSFDAYDVYRAEQGMVFLLIVMKDEAARRAVLCPAYYGFDDAATLRQGAERLGELYTHVRRLSEEYVHFTHDEPELFFPGGSVSDHGEHGGEDAPGEERGESRRDG